MKKDYANPNFVLTIKHGLKMNDFDYRNQKCLQNKKLFAVLKLHMKNLVRTY